MNEKTLFVTKRTAPIHPVWLMFFTLAVTLTLCGGTGAQGKKSSYRTYRNARFGYMITYPADLLYGQGEPDNGDGQKFLTRDTKAVLIVYAGYNAASPNETIQDKFHDDARGGTPEHPKRVVTYKVLRPTWYVVSGVEAGREFYTKVYYIGDTIYTMNFTYPEKEKRRYDPVTERLSRSFRVPKK